MSEPASFGGLQLLTGPTVEPVTPLELVEHLRLHYQDQANLDYLASLISAARASLEAMTRRAFLTQSWAYLIPTFPPGRETINVPRPFVQSIDVLGYVDENNVLGAVMNPIVSAGEFFCLIEPEFGQNWPATTTERAFAVVIQFTTGWPTPADMPPALRLAVKHLAAHWFENRQPATEVELREVPWSVEAMISPWKVWDWF
jgi:uncharacterized phiE125 gp8 family phage protein